VDWLCGPLLLVLSALKPEAPREVPGPSKPIATSVPGLRICEHLPRLARLAHRYALVRSVSHNNHNHTPMIYYTLTGRPVERPEQDNDVRPPQRSDFPHLGAVLARFKESRAGVPGYIAIPEVAVRSSTQGDFRRARRRRGGGGAGCRGPISDPLPASGEPGTTQAVPALSLPQDISAERLERRTALLSALEHRGAAWPGSHSQRALHRQAVALTGSS